MQQHQIDFMLTAEDLRRRQEHKEYQKELGKLLADAYEVGRLQEMLTILKEAAKVGDEDEAS